MLKLLLLSVVAAAVADATPPPTVSVREANGLYTVTAQFSVPQAPSVALAVLSDYEQIPRFIPDVKVSVIRERTAGRLLVEQEAESRFMMFSKKVHLLLEVSRDDHTIHFRDRCGKSFSTYEGRWRADDRDGGSLITYELSARPAFDVPEFILKRLLKRDSGDMIDRLRREIASR